MKTMESKPDYRTVRSMATSFNVREAESGPVIEGYFAVYNSPYIIAPGIEEIVLPGAFDGVLGFDVRALIDHNAWLVLGRTLPKTLMLRTDERGLYGVIYINRADVDAMNLYARTQRGDVNQASFGFNEEQPGYITLADGTIQWQITKVTELWEVSVCTFPAYEATSLTARKRDLTTIEIRQTEAWRSKMKERLHRNGT